MNEIVDLDRTSDPAHRRERGIEAYARIFDVPETDVPAAMAGRVGQVFAEEVFLAAGGPAWFHPALTNRERSMLIIAALAAQGVAGERLDVQRVAGPGSQTSPGNADVRHSSR